MPPSGVLIEFSKNASSAIWVGVVEGGKTIRFLAGEINNVPIVSGNLYEHVAYVDIKNFPKDNLTHSITMEFDPIIGSVRVWIDSSLRGAGNVIGDMVCFQSFAHTTFTFSSVAHQAHCSDYQYTCMCRDSPERCGQTQGQRESTMENFTSTQLSTAPSDGLVLKIRVLKTRVLKTRVLKTRVLKTSEV